MSRLDDRWSEIEPVLDDALAVPPAERAAVVARACGDDAELRELVLGLLAREDGTGSISPGPGGPFWDALAQELAGDPPSTSSTPGDDRTPVPGPGTVLDRYRILDELGRGGMSVVYRAERVDGAFDAPVALKLATTGLHPGGRARFARERQILATLRHPAIAQILDGGETDDGRPYLVMELVNGEPIDVHADRHRLSVDARLALFAEVAHAVQHAHRNLVVHRDLKPSNVLVDRDGRVKLLDFGIAALLHDEDETITRTQHLRPMTPAFASPEQLSGEPVTTVSDVYQLGHLLYRLLTGCPPYRPDTQDPEAWRRAVTGSDPVAPSEVVAREEVRQRLAPDGDAIARVAEQRATTPARLSRTLAGDLETIVLMALRREPDRRYASALQLAEDVERFRDGLPVRAQPDRASYRLRKFVARNRVAVSVGMLGVLLVAAFVVTVTLQARQLAAERDRARGEAETAEGVTGFLLDIFADSAPGAGSTIDVRALDVVNRAADRIQTDLADDPIVRARVLAAIGGLYNRFGEEDRGRPLLAEAVRVLTPVRDEHPLPWAFAVTELATLTVDDGYTDDEVSALTEVVGVYETALGEDAIETIGARIHLATARLWRGDFEGARGLHDRAIAAFDAIDPSTLDADGIREWLVLVSSITTVLSARGDTDGALRILETAYPLAVEADHPIVLYGITAELAEIHGARDEIDLLERFAREHLHHAERTFGPDNAHCAYAWRLIGRAEHAKGNYAQAEAAFTRMRSFPRDDISPGQAAAHDLALSELLLDAGRPAEAMTVARAGLDTLVDVFGYDTGLTAEARLHVARAHLDLGEVARADTTLRSLIVYLDARGRENRGFAETLETMARVHLRAGRPDSAIAFAERAVKILDRRAPELWKTVRARGVLGRAHLATGDTAAARRALTTADRALRDRGDRHAREVREALDRLDARSR